MNYPDCRTDENYNEKYLNAEDKKIVVGFDCCLESITCLIEGNLDVFPALERAINEKTREELKEAIETWAESTRNEMITGMIDAMSDEEYDSIKEAVNGRSEEEVGQRTGENGEETR